MKTSFFFVMMMTVGATRDIGLVCNTDIMYGTVKDVLVNMCIRDPTEPQVDDAVSRIDKECLFISEHYRVEYPPSTKFIDEIVVPHTKKTLLAEKWDCRTTRDPT